MLDAGNAEEGISSVKLKYISGAYRGRIANHVLLKELLEAEGQRFSSHVDYSGNICSRRIGPSAWYAPAHHFVVGKALHIAICAGAL
jgi:hypothetical protein